MPHKEKFIAALLAFVLGGLGAHRLYLGSRYWWAYPAWLIVGMAVYGLFGSKATFWIVVFALMPVWAGFAEAMGFAVVEDAKWDLRWNPHSGRHSENGWNCVMLAIVCLLLGTTACLTSIILAAQFYYEAAEATAPER